MLESEPSPKEPLFKILHIVFVELIAMFLINENSGSDMENIISYQAINESLSNSLFKNLSHAIWKFGLI